LGKFFNRRNHERPSCFGIKVCSKACDLID
jgi:hypothetical protein